jgi:hypothetical protein
MRRIHTGKAMCSRLITSTQAGTFSLFRTLTVFYIFPHQDFVSMHAAFFLLNTPRPRSHPLCLSDSSFSATHTHDLPVQYADHKL